VSGMSSILGLWRLGTSVIVAIFLAWFLSALIIGLLIGVFMKAVKTPPVETSHFNRSDPDHDTD
jgi:flagellar biosynthesis protein FliQ